MAFTFKLGNPTDKVQPGICRVPEWLEEHLASVSAEFDKTELGNVDISLIRGEVFDYNEQCRLFGDYYDYQNTEPINYGPVCENIPPVSDSNDYTNISERPTHPKVFCDDMYIRMMNLFSMVSDEKQASSVHTRIEGLLGKFEQKFLHQQ